MPRLRGSRGRNVNISRSMTIHKPHGTPNLDKLATQFLDPVVNYVWVSGVDPLNKTGDPNLWIREVYEMMRNHQLATAGVDLDEEIAFQVKWHKEYLAELKTMHELPEPVDEMDRHPPIYVLQQGKKWWDTMAKSGEAGKVSFMLIAERLKVLHDSGVGGDPLELMELVGKVVLQSLASGMAARGARRMKILYTRSIKERQRIAAENGTEEKETRDTKGTKEKQADPKENKETKAKENKETKAKETLALINATIQKLEGASI